MLFEEARIRSQSLVADASRAQLKSNLADQGRMNQLQREAALAGARLGLPARSAA